MRQKIVFYSLLATAFLMLGCSGKNYETLHESAKYGDEKLIRYYINKQKINPNSLDESGTTPLIYAAKYADEDIVGLLIKNGASVNFQDSYGRTALMAASAYNKKDAIILLMENKANPDLIRNDGMSAIKFARQYNHKAAEKLLLKYGATPTEDVNASVNARILLASEVGDLDSVEDLLEDGADINARYYNALSTPLIEAVKNNQEEVVEFLIKNGADREIVDISNKKAVDYAQNNPKILAILNK